MYDRLMNHVPCAIHGKIVCTLLVLIALTGCQKSVKQEENSLAVDPMADKVKAPAQFASIAIDKAGGLEAWGSVREIQLDCIVTFYDKDAGYYLTKQKYDIFPWSNSIVISGNESNAAYSWQLSEGNFVVLKGADQINGFNNQIGSGYFAEAILNLVTAPARFLDKSVEYSRKTDAVNIQGRWCYPITRSIKTGKQSIPSNIVFYQNRSNSLVDMLLLSGKNNNEYFRQSKKVKYQFPPGLKYIQPTAQVFLRDSYSGLIFLLQCKNKKNVWFVNSDYHTFRVIIS